MQSQLPKTRDLVCNMLLLTFEQTFTGGAVWLMWGGGGGEGDAEAVRKMIS